MNSIQKHLPETRLSTFEQNQLLERYYDRLQTWALVLTRGDLGKSQDIVQELCLHLSLSAPNFNNIQNLDGYLYTCLRHIYLSDIARSSREALQHLSIEGFDSIQLALSSNGQGESLPQQNDLRRICSFVIWRKAQTKSASYFILRFFHGYYRAEIATIAGVGLSTIDPKLNKARSEVSLYLSEPDKLKFTSREIPPVPRLQWTPISSIELFKELRETILAGRQGECLSERELLSHYEMPTAEPIACSLLSHIVSCERCLSLIDKHFDRPSLKERDPLDGTGSRSDAPSSKPANRHVPSREEVFRSVRRYSKEIFELRPKRLSIAVDGKILASRDVQSESSMLSVRVHRPQDASFIEVFTEQGIRLALVSLIDHPPEGPHQQTQHISLSDNRWLELTLTFDGLGLNSEITYIDPLLAASAAIDEEFESLALAHPNPFRARKLLAFEPSVTRTALLRRLARMLIPLPVACWAVVLGCLLLIVGYCVHHYEKPAKPYLAARQILDHSAQIEAAKLKGQTEHQVLHFEERSQDGSILRKGSIDRWKDGDGKRLMRRLYDSKHHLVAADWTNRENGHGQYRDKESNHPSEAENLLMVDDLWQQDMSPTSFRNLNGDNAKVRVTDEGYTLTAVPGDARPHLLLATLIIDKQLHPIREVLRIRRDAKVFEVGFEEASYERQTAVSVPDIIFDPRAQGLISLKERASVMQELSVRSVHLTELYIAVLLRLNSLNADTSDPIEVMKTSDGHLRVVGIVSSDARKEEILAQLRQLDNYQDLDMRLISPNDIVQEKRSKPQTSVPSSVSTYDIAQTQAPVDTLLRAYFLANGSSGADVDTAVSKFSRGVLNHAQCALQHASVLKYLGDSFSPSELKVISRVSQQQWAELAAKHAVALKNELYAINTQLTLIVPMMKRPQDTDHPILTIENPDTFRQAANDLFVQTKALDEQVSNVFASSQAQGAQVNDMNSLVAAIKNAIPLQDSIEMSDFTTKLDMSGSTASNRQAVGTEMQPTGKL